MNQANLQALQQTIDAAWEDRANLSPKSAPKDILEAVEQT
ncbi:MAG: 2,3,4,5-tetrahydropyridine-2,6-dicarboxylate N-succinyltransferase, partial [Polaromonas sp.]|nr:2,3,4,5-tetrahydropyridine-2,6-dicarboxylate N-succinyltransferase [Polaromonas sp.]